MSYLDGFLLACPSAAKSDYVAMAEAAAHLFRKAGARETVELWGDDIPDGTVTSMPMAVKKADDEVVVFSWIAWPDKATRDAGMATAMEDEGFKAAFSVAPFDGKRMMFGGFVPVVSVGDGTLSHTNYVDGMVAAVPEANREAFIAHARSAAEIFAERGAVRVVETWADDVPDGTLTSFPMAVKKEPGEAVVFSFIVWPDKATRDGAWQAIMADPRMDPANNPMPFDGSRLIWGGFTPVVVG